MRERKKSFTVQGSSLCLFRAVGIVKDESSFSLRAKRLKEMKEKAKLISVNGFLILRQGYNDNFDEKVTGKRIFFGVLRNRVYRNVAVGVLRTIIYKSNSVRSC